MIGTWQKRALVAGIWLVLAAANSPSVEAIRHWQARLARVQAIARQVLAANLAACPRTRRDFGMSVVSPNPAATPEVRAAWREALQLGEGATVSMVLADSPAAAAELRKGDEVLAVNGIARDTDLAGFDAALRESGETKTLLVRRAGVTRTVYLRAQPVCNAQVALLDRKGANASANGDGIFIERDAPDLLDDDELAFLIAHEAAHVFLGHSHDAAAMKDPARRKAAEIAADRLGLRLMLRAGFAPEAAARAHPKLAAANRGPISRLLDLHGPYMGTAERVTFLAAQAEAARKEAEAH